MQGHYVIEQSLSQEQFTLMKVPHKRVLSELNSQEIRNCLGTLDAPLTESIRESTLRGIYLLNDLIVMKEVLNMQQCFRVLAGEMRNGKGKGNVRGDRDNHKRNSTLETNHAERSLKRANIINQIISKLHGFSKPSPQSKLTPRSNSNNPNHLLTQELKNLLHSNTNPSLNSKPNNYLSTQQSNIQSKTKFQTKQSTTSNFEEDSKKDIIKKNNLREKVTSQNKQNCPSSMFRKLRNQITKVKKEVQELKVANEEYRVENRVLRLRSAENSKQPRWEGERIGKKGWGDCACYRSCSRRNIPCFQNPYTQNLNRNISPRCHNCGVPQLF